MISTKKLISMAKKWQKLAAASRKRISWLKSETEKGHFVVYTMDGRRFVIPLKYLQSEILRELLKMAKEEFGVTSDGPIRLPCDSRFMEYAISILQRYEATDLQKALLLSMDSCCSSSLSYSQQEQTNQQLLICSF
ncbi:auxin-responsive protein SAUR64-like [Chenopodium quinoa]|uniref:auxin-responsive protein SAUR64-like n=1 Tax=Chenopodium quinoa TaxID=63459 RepID=UPI000B774CC7|nr:auxin-responsive protein SAUR64-like [Chenopodium quinoa]